MAETILYVDDDTANLAVLQATCEDEFSVLTASSGDTALEVLREQEIAVLLVDQRMPGMTGVEVLERARELSPDTVRILITAYADLSDAINAINRGQVRRYLRKPWDADELKATLHEALEVYTTRSRLHQLERRLLETERVYALGVVAAGVAHELRNPLSVLVGRLELARTRARKLQEALAAGVTPGDGERESIRKVAEFIDHAVDAVGQIVEITQGVEIGQRRRDEQQEVDFEEVVNLTMRSVKGTLLKRATIEFETESVPIVRGSATRLGQVTLNLLVNALQALPDRQRKENRVSVRLGRRDDFAALEVEDNGAGIPEEARDRIFDPFFTTKTEGGTGLGLAISKTIVEETGGKILVDSVVGQGTRFTVLVPLAKAASRKAGQG